MSLCLLLLILFQSEIRQVLEKVSPLRYLRSRRRSIQNSFVNDLSHVLVDLNTLSAGQHLIKISGQSVDVPSGVKIDRIILEHVRVNLIPLTAEQVSE